MYVGIAQAHALSIATLHMQCICSGRTRLANATRYNRLLSAAQLDSQLLRSASEYGQTHNPTLSCNTCKQFLDDTSGTTLRLGNMCDRGQRSSRVCRGQNAHKFGSRLDNQQFAGAPV